MEGKDWKVEQKKIRLKILDIQGSHCVGCTLPPDGSPAKKQKYCWSSCIHGIELRKLADELVSNPGEKGFAVMVPENMEPTKENYLYLKNENVIERRVAGIFGIESKALRKLKEEWGLPKIHDRDTRNKATAPAPDVIVITKHEYVTLSKDRDRAMKALLKKTKESQTTYKAMKERENTLMGQLESVTVRYARLQEQVEAGNVFNK